MRSVSDARVDVFKPETHALEFVRGETDGVTLPVADDGETSYTVIGWAGYHDLVGSGSLSGAMFRDVDSGGNEYGFAVHTDGGGQLNVFLRNRTTGTSVNPGWSGAAPGRYLLAGIKNKDTAELWANSDLKASAVHPDGNFQLSGVEFRLGNTVSGDEFDGLLDAVALYNRALSGVEQVDIYRTGIFPTDGLQAFYHFDEGEGTTADDDVGTNDGTISGADYRLGIAPNARVFADDIGTFDVSSRIQDLVDRGSLTIPAVRTIHGEDITSGDRLRVYTRLDGEASLSHRYTGMARDLEYTQETARKTSLDVGIDDFVFGILDTRTVVNAFQNRAVAGSSDAILNRILANNAPELDRSGIGNFTASTASVQWNNTSLLDAVSELADRVDAVVSGTENMIHFERITDKAPAFSLVAADKGLHSLRENDDSLANVLRVSGGTGHSIDDSQQTQDGYTTVTQSSRITHQLDTRKSEVARIDVWTRLTGSGENVKVRLQSDDAGEPKNPASTEVDITARTLAPDFIADADFTSFLMPNNTLMEAHPWVIIESTGPQGQDIGVDTSTGYPTYKSYFPYPLTVENVDRDSRAEYRRREIPVQKESLESRKQAIEFSDAVLSHVNAPDRELSFPAMSVRAHDLDPGELVDVDEPKEHAVGAFIVTDVAYTYDGIRLETDVTAQEVETV